MILNLLKIKATSLVNDFKRPLNILAHLLMAFVAVTYGYGAGKIINSAANGEVGKLSPDMFIGIIFGAILMMVIMRMFVPTYTPQRSIFPPFYPLSKFQIYWASVVQDVTKPLYFYMTLFMAVVFGVVRYEEYLFLFSALGTLYSALFLRKIIQYPIDFNLSKKGYLLAFVTLASIIGVASLIVSFNKSMLYAIIILPFLLFAIGYTIEKEILTTKVKTSRVAKREMNIFLKLLMNCPNLRAPLMMSLVFKGFFLAYFLFLSSRNPNDKSLLLFVFMFTSPFALFANIFNNTWGFWKSIWLNFELRTGSYKQMIAFKLKLVAIPLLADLIISLPFLIYITSDYLFIATFYLTAVVALLSSSFLWSVLFPIATQPMKAFQMKKNTSQWASIITMVAIMILTSIYYHKWAYLLIPIYLGGSLVAYLLAKDYYKDKKYLLAKTLLKE